MPYNIENEWQSGMSQILQYQSYLVRRKVLKLWGAAFHIFDPSGRVVFYSKQKAFKLREDIRLYTGEDMIDEVLCIQARNIIDFSASYDVFDSSTHTKVGALRRKGIKSLLKDEWIILDAHDREIGLIGEDSIALALLRRFLINLVPQKYCGIVNEQQVCIFRQYFNPFVMKIQLDYSMDIKGILDRRIGIAAAVLLCAIEGKQN